MSLEPKLKPPAPDEAELEAYAKVLGFTTAAAQTAADKAKLIEQKRGRCAELTVLGIAMSIPVRRAHDRRFIDAMNKEDRTTEELDGAFRFLLGDEPLEGVFQGIDRRNRASYNIAEDRRRQRLKDRLGDRLVLGDLALRGHFRDTGAAICNAGPATKQIGIGLKMLLQRRKQFGITLFHGRDHSRCYAQVG